MKTFLLLVISMVLFYISSAQNPGSIDPSFANLRNKNSIGSVSCLAIQKDGKLVIAGDVGASFGSKKTSGVARLNVNGSFDSTFCSNQRLFARRMQVAENGKIYVLHDSSLVRLNPDGSEDEDFVCGVSVPSKFLVQKDGHLLVSEELPDGDMLYRLDSLGLKEINFAPKEYGSISEIRENANGDFFVAAYSISFLDYDVYKYHSDGTRDNSFISSVDYLVLDMECYPDGRIVLIEFNYLQNTCNVVRLNVDGSRDNSLIYSSIPVLYRIALNSLGEIYIYDEYIRKLSDSGQVEKEVKLNGGLQFLEIDPFNRIIQGDPLVGRYTSECIIDTTFSITTSSNYNSFVQVDASGNIYMNKVVGISPVSLFRLDKDGNPDPGFQTDSCANCHLVDVYPDGRSLVRFDDSLSIAHVRRLLPNGSLDPDFKEDTSYISIFETKLLKSQRIIGSVYKDQSNFVVRYNSDGSIDPSFAATQTLGPRNYTEAPDGKIYFQQLNPAIFGYGLHKLLRDGEVDPDFAVFENDVSKYCLLSDGRLVVVWRESNSVKLARLLSNGKIDSSVPIMTLDYNFTCLLTDASDNIYIAFGNHFARYTRDLVLDSSFDQNTFSAGSVLGAATQGDNKIILAGYFVNFSGEPWNGLVRLFNSKDLGLNESSESLSDWIIYPNPAGDVLRIKTTNPGIQKLNVKLVSVLGDEILTTTITAFDGKAILPTADVQSGLYTLQLNTPAQSISKKIVVQH